MPAPLISLAVSSDLVVMGVASNDIILIELAHEDRVNKVQIPRKPGEFTIHKLFLDPSGRHLIIASQQGENWYLYKGWKKPKQLKSWKIVIESVAWSRASLLASSNLTSTREMLVGGRNGTIYEALLDAEEDFFKSQERYFSPVFTLVERQPITGLNFDFFPPTDPRRGLVAVTTPSRFYQFVGAPDRRSDDNGRVFTSLFASYREAAPSTCGVGYLFLLLMSHVKMQRISRTLHCIPNCIILIRAVTRRSRYQRRWHGWPVSTIHNSFVVTWTRLSDTMN
jgi:vacuolar protein sorting-associated protein 18